jgi:hypothetical protein
MANRHTTKHDINATERAKLALSLRKQGYTLDDIAKQCSYQDRSGAFRAIKRELDRLVTPDAADLRKLEELRLDAMLVACYPKAEKGDLWAIDRVIAISKRRSEVMGFDVKPEEQVGPQIIIEEVALNYLEGPKT